LADYWQKTVDKTVEKWRFVGFKGGKGGRS
jgi:hypothetical protein